MTAIVPTRETSPHRGDTAGVCLRRVGRADASWSPFTALLAIAAVCVAMPVGGCAGTGDPTAVAAPDARAKFDDPIEFEVRDRPVTIEDVAILRRAAALLADDAVWNRQDDRDCRDDEATGRRSLFCALHRASIDVLGTYDHRRVALQEVRFAVEEATRGMELEHRLKDFNNLPRTDLAAVHRVLAIAIGRVRARLRTTTD